MPGPNVLVVVSASMSEGKSKGFQTVFGISIAMALQLAIATIGSSWFVNALAQGFQWLKWLGVAYLLYLSIHHFRAVFSEHREVMESSSIGLFRRGFFVSLTNPKTILFFGAFLPQFTTLDSSFLLQIALLSVTFWLLALAVNIGYTLLSSTLAIYLSSARLIKVKHGISGALYLGSGAVLATIKRE